jgi:hypothetical protein
MAVIFSTASGSTDSFCGWGILRDGAAEDDDGGGGGFLRERNTIFPVTATEITLNFAY